MKIEMGRIHKEEEEQSSFNFTILDALDQRNPSQK